jgi:hypothetical protein
MVDGTGCALRRLSVRRNKCVPTLTVALLVQRVYNTTVNGYCTCKHHIDHITFYVSSNRNPKFNNVGCTWTPERRRLARVSVTNCTSNHAMKQNKHHELQRARTFCFQRVFNLGSTRAIFACFQFCQQPAADNSEQTRSYSIEVKRLCKFNVNAHHQKLRFDREKKTQAKQV